MKKQYRSATVLSLNVMIDGKYKRHVTFNAAACSGSSLATSDERLQKALESHYLFGKKFVLSGAEEEKPVAAVEAAEADEDKKVKVSVSSLSDAKDYLAEKFEISRTKLRTRDAIIKTAEQHDVEFVGI